jgi:hypothetical protein
MVLYDVNRRLLDRLFAPGPPGSFRIWWSRSDQVIPMPEDPEDPDSLERTAKDPRLSEEHRRALISAAAELRRRA